MIRFHKPFLAAVLLAGLATVWLAWSRLDTARRRTELRPAPASA